MIRLTNVFLLIFLLAAFALGSATTNLDRPLIDSAFDNASIKVNNITLDTEQEYEGIPNFSGLFKVLEKYMRFVGTLVIEVFRAGIYFGQDNPEYFNSDFIFKVIKLIVVLTIISLLIKPVSYLVVLLVLGGMYINGKLKRKKKSPTKSKEVKK